MYFVNREKIEEILSYMEKIQEEMTEHSYERFSNQLLLERMTQLNIEAIIDVGNMMIDGFIMRDPGSYEDVIDILTDEKVLPESEQEAYKQFIQLRKMIVQQYTNVDHEKIVNVWQERKHSLQTFPSRVRRYLDNELGPVSAFSKS
ncbi:DUF86 domain-containing protein [Halobacillus litoralis]|uniref:DUF86 domain-containing protein n=1 Tax=Halobacillus litoralis TaxID=45668 RepID=A0A845F902_9BACI|nr:MULTISPECIES: DUF86 domain-containing protein [Halobacillus]MEC3882500.1 DUF86 domain-containing protein [Halobacillus sp. HZG1]MYL70166.1 DUF86 domain-containing protein [Halobacillus litoralis]